jgi:adenylate cyclase
MARFGRLCAGLPPERISALLTDQLDRFTRILMRQKGTVDDYLGESLLAFWGAPGAVEDGPARACLAALQCLKAESELAQSDPAIAPDLVQNLFAVHAGPCIVGNIGSQRYLAYTAIGDNVELVWRLKQQNRRYGTRILVTAPIREAVADEFWFRRLDLIPVHDGTARLAIYELQGERSLALPVEDQLYARAYERALDDLLAGDFESADVGFSALLAERPRDPALHLMRRRCLARSLLPCSAEDDLEPQTP